MTVEHQAASAPVPASEEQPAAVIGADNALRLILLLLAIWTVFSALALIIFQDGSGATVGGGLDGGEGTAAKRLLGVHLFVLAPIYALLAWEPHRYRMLLWVPYVAQGGTVLVTLFDLLAGERDIVDGFLPLVISSVFFALLLYVWYASRQAEYPVVATTVDAPSSPASQPGPETAPPAAPPPSPPEDLRD
jgi:hypothetical protein